MAEDQQIPMFPDGEFPSLHPREQLLFRLVQMQAEVVRIQAAALAAMQASSQHLESTPHDGLVARRRAMGPEISKWRIWRSFCLDLQELEKLIAPPVTKLAIAMRSGCTAKTVTRTMQGYGLRSDQWPPSTWNPDEARVYHSPN